MTAPAVSAVSAVSVRHGALGALGAALVACVLVLAACGSSTTPGASSGAGHAPTGTGAAAQVAGAPPSVVTAGSTQPTPTLPVTITSADGNPVTITDVSRIVPLWSSISEVAFSLGLGANVVARDIATTFPEAQHLPLVTQSHDVSAEAVLSLSPTVVLAQDDTGPPEALDAIRNAGVPVVVIASPTDIDDIAPRIRTIASALGVPAEGEALIERTEKEIVAVQRTIPQDVTPPKVAFLYMRGSAGVYLIGGPRSGADSMIKAAGATDAGTAMGLTKTFTPITSEGLVQAAPDVILMTTTGLESVGGIDGLVKIPGIAQTPAGQNRRVVTEEDGLLYSFGGRTPLALRGLIDALYGSGTAAAPGTAGAG